MATKKHRKPDGFAPYFLETKDGVAYITFQLGNGVLDFKWMRPVDAVSTLRVPTHTIALDPDSGVPIENRQSKPRRKKSE